MIWRLEYCNKFGDTARLDIQKGASTPILEIEGTGNPFSLNYKLDAPNKTGYFMSSSAEISIFEAKYNDPLHPEYDFNIDRLKTSSETELKVNYYVNSVLKWTGFILPDFFSRQIGEPAVVEMTATDRLGALKGATLTELTAKVSLRSLLTQSLAKTGLTLPLNATASFTHGATNILDTEILSQRLTDNKGRSISCYDIIKSILVATNATIRQVNGEWRLYNKIEHEAVASSVTFNEVERGARRTIEPVASSVGIFKEFGGGRKYPLNYDFSQGAINWTPVNGFTVAFDNREILGYTIGSPTTVNYGNPTEKQYLVNDNEKPGSINTDFNASPYLKYEIAMPSGYTDSVNISVDINAIGIRGSRLMYQLLAKKGTTVLSMGFNGDFMPFENDNDLNAMWLSFPMEAPENAYTKSKLVTGKLEDIDLSGYTLELRLYGLRLNFVNYLSIKISDNAEIAKGDLYKTEQIGEFTKKHETDTVIFGDYLTKGLNGYFYEYPIDDTSNLYIGNDLTTGVWTSYNDSTQLPLLQHVTRQKSRLYSIAHDILRATIELRSFNPLAIYQSCDGEKWVIIESNYDFLRSKVDVVLEQIKYGSLEKRDFIYSYFGEGEDNIKSVGGISGGTSGGGGGGGLTPEQLEILSFWKKDPDNPNTIYTEKNAYSHGGLSAYGAGTGGGGGTGGTLAGLSDVTLTSLSTNDLLRFNGTKWVNVPQSSITPNLTGYVQTSRLISAGTGLSGGGNLTANRTLSLDTGFTDGRYAPISHVSATNNPHNVTASQVGAYTTGQVNTLLNNKTSYRLNSSLTNSFKRIAIGLIRLDTGANSYERAIGTLSLNRDNGLYVGKRFDFIIQKRYNQTNMFANVLNLSTFSDFRPCKFMYNGILYGGFDIYVQEANARYIDFIGESTQFVVIEYYNPNTSTAINTEVNNSIESQAYESSPMQFNGTNIAWVTSNVASATKLQTARTIWGQSFDGTGNITGNMTGVGNILPSATATYNLGNSSLMFERAYIRNIDTQSGYFLRFNVAGSEYMTINTSGNIGIGTTSPSQKLHVFGNILATGGITAYTTSDIRLKTNIKPIESPLAKILKLNPVTYNYNHIGRELNSSLPNTDYGLIAQDVKNILPDIVHGMYDNKYFGIDYIKLVPILIGAIKELNDKLQ